MEMENEVKMNAEEGTIRVRPMIVVMEPAFNQAQIPYEECLNAKTVYDLCVEEGGVRIAAIPAS